ncbi:MAG: hypothetical protein ACOCWA_06230 [Bacteroidota bacterium]
MRKYIIILIVFLSAEVFADDVKFRHLSIDDGLSQNAVYEIEFTVKQGHDYAFREGIKVWKECYLKNEGEWKWTLWRRIQGEGNVYALTSYMENWSEMDETDSAGKGCRDNSRELINPHIEKAEYSLYRTMPDYSADSDVDNKIVWVTFWDVKNSDVFKESIKKVSEILGKEESDTHGTWYLSMGGAPDAANYFVATPFENWAALDVERDGVWKVVEESEGEKVKDELRANMRSSVNDVWSYIYERQDELSNLLQE